jgi:hypothetical protein
LIKVETIQQNVENDDREKDSIEDPFEQIEESKDLPFLTYIVEEWKVFFQIRPKVHLFSFIGDNKLFVVQVLIENCPDDQRHRSKSQVISGDIPIIENAQSGVSIVEAVHHLRNREDHVFVEEVEDHFGNPDIAPSTMDHKQPPKSFEFGQSIVAGLHCAHSFLSVYSYADVGFLDHVNIIRSISN